jgi:hypothetical protein
MKTTWLRLVALLAVTLFAVSMNCRIESYPEGSYCFVDGNECCVD